jgi:predicted DNA-binding ribbon-helix-helix protein
MRTTLTLDDDIAAKLKEIARRRKMPFKEVVNTVLRRGLVAPEPRRSRSQRFRVEVFNSPFRAGIDPLRLNQLADELEVEEAAARIRR